MYHKDKDDKLYYMIRKIRIKKFKIAKHKCKEDGIELDAQKQFSGDSYCLRQWIVSFCFNAVIFAAENERKIVYHLSTKHLQKMHKMPSRL